MLWLCPHASTVREHCARPEALPARSGSCPPPNNAARPGRCPVLANLCIGNNTSVQKIWGTQNFHLAIMIVEQKLFNGWLIIQAGCTTANVNFLNSPIYCYFQTNSAYGNPTFIFKNSSFAYFPNSTWGSDAKFLFTPKTYVHVRVYEDNPRDMSANNNGFSLNFRA
jgi:porin